MPKDGLVVKSNTAKLRKHRRLILEMLLASHRVECTTCDQSGNCKLQEYANRYGVHKVRFENDYCKIPIDATSPSIVRDPSKCILCAKCVRMCSEVQNIGAIDLCHRGRETYVTCGFGQSMMRNKGIVLSREMIENNLWNFDYEGGTNVVDVYVSFLRKKLDTGFDKKLIHTVWGTGWVLKEES